MSCMYREKCYVCGLPIAECICDDEDFEDDGETQEVLTDQQIDETVFHYRLN